MVSPREKSGTADPSAQARDVQSYFDGVAGSWSDHYAPGGRMAGRIERFTAACEAYSRAQMRVLDFGCGSGELAVALAQKGWRVTGCDISGEMLRHAEAAPGGGGVTWQALDVAGGVTLPFDGESFDLAVASSVFEYVLHPEAHLKELCRILMPGGHLLVTVPDMRHDVRIKEESQRHDLRGRVARFVRRVRARGEDTDYYGYSVTRHAPEHWIKMLSTCGFTPEPLPNCEDPLLLLRATKC